MYFPVIDIERRLWKRFHLNLYLRRARGCWLSRNCWKQWRFSGAQSALNATASNSRSSFPKPRAILPTCNARRFRYSGIQRCHRNSRESLRDRVRILWFHELNRVGCTRRWWSVHPASLRRFDKVPLKPSSSSVTLIHICVNAHRDRKKKGDCVYKRRCASQLWRIQLRAPDVIISRAAINYRARSFPDI